MMKILIRTFALLGLSVLIWTCSEDFLDTPPQGSLSASNLSAQEGIDAALISAYSRVDGWANDWGQSAWGTSGSNWLFGSVPSDDTHKGSEPADGVTMGQIELFQWRPSLPEFQSKFLVVYDGIRRANETLSLINANENLSQADRDRLTGEARFLRGHYHMEAWKMWENVPYFSEEDTDFRKPNDQDIFPLIVADFEAAASLLPATQAEVGRATSTAANAMLGRLHMLNGDMASASAALNQVTGRSLADCFHDMFTTSGENGPEMIFSIQASVNDGSGGSDNANFGDRLNFPHAGSPIGCCGFHQPTQNLVNAFRVDENGLPLMDNSSDSNPAADEPVDPRLDWTVGRDGVPYLNWGFHEPSWIRDRAWSSEYSPKKFTHTPDEASNVGWVQNQLTPINVPIIRYADVLLMQAEIDVENNRLEDARAKVNMIRERAGNCAQGADQNPVPLDDPSTSHATYSVGTYDDPWTDQAAAREAVRLERRLELALEGHRWFDLRRYGESYMLQTMRDYLAVEETRREFLQQAEGPTSVNMLFPIPTAAIDQSQVDGNPTLRQNEGY
ncbi:RagB/SusD family nutrient uptake outer membrane protein [Lewinella sp. W8]|uniref:RagB/SusD family nutrient uptake outer membrane protein n=1 Tax=Lewinella sp. W8 TaxID=2528208 RepID=UPI00106732ED|nr:RagB/SusD family nutrient uptake outer membrane protein [Lewinella sp. W8]MTB50950.1 RagB/SusD family nutrient uptake outer membrane protein [Lewinella sp. W8]